MAGINYFTRFARSFFGRMLLGLLAVHALLLPALTFGVYRIITEDIKNEFVNYARSQAYQYVITLQQMESREAIHVMLQELVLARQVVYVDQVTPDSRIEGRMTADGAEKLNFNEDFHFGGRNDNTYFIAIDSAASGATVGGKYRFGFDETPVLERINLIFKRSLYWIGGYLFALILLIGFFGSRLSRTIRRLSDATGKIAVGEMDEALQLQSGISEIDGLSEALEHMRQELVKRGKSLHQLAYFDGLTDLSNRHAFTQQLENNINQAYSQGQKLAILNLDLDRFKRVNDTLGHSAGDELLRIVASRLLGCLRMHETKEQNHSSPSSDMIARFGGDEFVIQLPMLANNADAGKVAQRILDALRTPISIGDHTVYCTGSIGIAVFPQDGMDAGTLLKNADMAMYSAKEDGKNRYRFFSASTNRATAAVLALESQLQKAVENNELVLHYQPQLDLDSNQVIGVEALVRWNHPERGMISPAEFIPLAEDSGLITYLDEWVIAAACRQHKIWRAMSLPPLRMSVNISTKEFARSSLLISVAEAVRANDVSEDMLELEITESCLMQNQADARVRLQELNSLGVRLAVDDFGTGYSSLGYLKRFPLDTLKIDRAFVRDLETDSDSRAITAAIIAMAHKLKLKVVAEGVETSGQLMFLQVHGCEVIQGFLLAKPMPPDELVHFLLQHSSQKQASTALAVA
jgi:diguanylate cyclase (GGDEF)-like protein